MPNSTVEKQLMIFLKVIPGITRWFASLNFYYYYFKKTIETCKFYNKENEWAYMD
jgi:hypothetical protein